MSMYKQLSYNQRIDTVKRVQFSVLGAEEILQRSVVEVTKTDTYSGNEPVIFFGGNSYSDFSYACYNDSIFSKKINFNQIFFCKSEF